MDLLTVKTLNSGLKVPTPINLLLEATQVGSPTSLPTWLQVRRSQRDLSRRGFC